MSDDWSLKGKILISEVDTWDDEVHLKEDIDTLREKLIDDFKEIAQGESPDNVVWVETLLCDIIDMINKRFGIDDE